ncbi:MAG: hypothetical protein ACI9YL_001676 [Luteibaculaceae bacterium]|jgi:hypothetical protein
MSIMNVRKLVGCTLVTLLISCEKEKLVSVEETQNTYQKSNGMDSAEQLKLPMFFQRTLDSVTVDPGSINQFVDFQSHLNSYEIGLGENQNRKRFLQALKSDTVEVPVLIWDQIMHPQTPMDSLRQQLWYCLERSTSASDFQLCWELGLKPLGPDDENDLEKGDLQLAATIVFHCFQKSEQTGAYGRNAPLVKEMLKGVLVGELEMLATDNFNQYGSAVRLSWIYWRENN